MSSAPPSARLGRVIALYTVLRVVALVGAYGLLLLVGLRGLLALAAALLLSSVISMVALRRQRDDVVTGLEARRTHREAERARLRGLLDDGSTAG